MYFVYSFDEADSSAAVDSAIFLNITKVLLGDGALSGCVMCIAMLTIRRLTRQIGRLNRWAQQLDMGNVAVEVEDFRYRELNELADLLSAEHAAGRVGRAARAGVLADLSPVHAQAPPSLFDIVVTNIVRNAFQHAAQGQVVVALSG